MRLASPSRLFALAAAIGGALGFTVLSSFAVGEAGTSTAPCTCPGAGKLPRPKFAGAQTTLDDGDEIAALQAIHIALSRAGDGATFVWRRQGGHLAGVVQPTVSFRSSRGAICRHLVVLLTTGEATKKTEGIACRLANGRWQLDG